MTRWEICKQNRTEYFWSIRLKKKEIWDRFVGEAKKNEEIWGVSKYSLKQRCQKMTTLEHEGKAATTCKEKEEILRKNTFPEVQRQTNNPTTETRAAGFG